MISCPFPLAGCSYTEWTVSSRFRPLLARLITLAAIINETIFISIAIIFFYKLLLSSFSSSSSPSSPPSSSSPASSNHHDDYVHYGPFGNSIHCVRMRSVVGTNSGRRCMLRPHRVLEDMFLIIDPFKSAFECRFGMYLLCLCQFSGGDLDCVGFCPKFGDVVVLKWCRGIGETCVPLCFWKSFITCHNDRLDS